MLLDVLCIPQQCPVLYFLPPQSVALLIVPTLARLEAYCSVLGVQLPGSLAVIEEVLGGLPLRETFAAGSCFVGTSPGEVHLCPGGL